MSRTVISVGQRMYGIYTLYVKVYRKMQKKKNVTTFKNKST